MTRLTAPLSQSRIRRLAAGAIAAIVLAVLAVIHAPGTSAHGSRPEAAKPTVVLVHGDWADASGWSGVIARLQADGYPVVAPPNPLRSLSGTRRMCAPSWTRSAARSCSSGIPTAAR